MTAEKENKIYTKGGDKGKTSLLDGKRVPKYHIRIEAYGTTDELKSYLPLISLHQSNNVITNIIEIVQEKLFRIEALLATENNQLRKSLPQIFEDDVLFLEKEIDKMNASLPPLNNFVMPGGAIAAVHAHVARCICRRAERIVIALSEKESVNPLIIQYFNRLSDFLFVLARLLCRDDRTCNESIWKTKDA